MQTILVFIVSVMASFWLAAGAVWADTLPKECAGREGEKLAMNQPKMALVIGNYQYTNETPLTNPEHDAQDLSATLRSELLGFDVEPHYNIQTKQAFLDILDCFQARAKKAQVAWLFFSGHGVQDKRGNSYILPTHTDTTQSGKLLYSDAVNIEEVVAFMREPKRLAVVVIDACRNNPYRNGTKASNKGITLPKNVPGPAEGELLLVYSAGPGQVADEGEGRNSPFVDYVRQELVKPQKLYDIFWNTRQQVHQHDYLVQQSKLSAGQSVQVESVQLPQIYADYLLSDAYLVSPPVTPPVTPPLPKLIAAIEKEMVTIPAGEFRMGSNNGDSDEKPAHRVKVPAFKMLAHEVTWAMYQPCIDAGKCPDNKKEGGDKGWGKGQRPVINVSWNDITQHYLPWLNSLSDQQYRLPSEAEWEYAARAGSIFKYSWGDTIQCTQAQYGGWDGACKNSDKTVAVKSYQPNAFGLYDMHGNVCEWTQDCWHRNYDDAPEDGTAWLADNKGECDKHVLRGGSWVSSPDSLRSAYRGWSLAANRGNDGGFRLVQDTP